MENIFLTTQEILQLDRSELMYRVEALQKEMKKLQITNKAHYEVNNSYMSFMVSRNLDMEFFKWLATLKKEKTNE